MQILNDDFVPTCVRPQGSSVVDLVWVTFGLLNRVHGWRVLEDHLTLSDHRVVETRISWNCLRYDKILSTRFREFPVWQIRKLDIDLLKAFFLSFTWINSVNTEASGAGLVNDLNLLYREASDFAMPRRNINSGGGRKSVYWWSEEIGVLRKSYHAIRRKYVRARKGDDLDTINRLKAELKTAQSRFKKSIFTSKKRCWEEFLKSIEKDTWGLPYKLVMGKLKPSSPPITESVEFDFLNEIVEALFPVGKLACPSFWDITWSDDWNVTELELRDVIRRMGTKNKASGPDGLWRRVLSLSMPVLFRYWLNAFNACLREGHFPDSWKLAKLVLIRKPGKPMDSPSSFRPICLLSECGKLFERVLAKRIGDFVEINGKLSENQFGFRNGRSTLDAVAALRCVVDRVTKDRKFVIAVSLDIKNAFNSIPWIRILSALEAKGVPYYLRRIVADYLSNRWISFVDNKGNLCKTRMSCGVPQGSVLGPLLWNITYDEVLRIEPEVRCFTVCYADDTLVVVKGSTLERAVLKGERAVKEIISRIEHLGLSVAVNKTEAIVFCSSLGRLRAMSMKIKDVSIPVVRNIKYLGLFLDSRWNFGFHFQKVIAKVDAVSRSLNKLMPNLGGPREMRRKLYYNVAVSILMYGAPIWANDIQKDRTVIRSLRRIQRGLCNRVACAYKTVAYDAIVLLARAIPLDILALRYKDLYIRTQTLRDRGVALNDRTRNLLRMQVSECALNIWKDRFVQAEEEGLTRFGRRVRSGIIPHFDSWMSRSHGELTFHSTQILTGHGCFADYLCRIRRVPTSRCYHCTGGYIDDAQHTLEHCEAWDDERAVLFSHVGGDLSLAGVIQKILDNEDNWRSFIRFCSNVMRIKEDAERSRQAALFAPPPAHA